MSLVNKKREYDSSLGGHVVLANQVQTYRYAGGAVKDLRQIMYELKNPSNSNKLVFQTLPKHMRRRAMSHHPKRLPRKYRKAHIAQMSKAGKPTLTKRPSRKFRRRPKNLMRDYIRRQRRHVWLETHIWHAKRFHMINRWGYRLPYASCDKTYRASYRATSKHCLLQDISFFACIQLEGTLQELGAGFKRLSSNDCGLSITARAFTSGSREGHIELFRIDRYPECALGKISFIWKALDEEIEEREKNDVRRMLWLWLHPSAYTLVLDELIKVFELQLLRKISENVTKYSKTTESVDEEPTSSSIAKNLVNENVENENEIKKAIKGPQSVKKLRRLRFMSKNLAYKRIKCYVNDSNTLRLSELKDTMNRFRLTGPLAQAVLAQVLKPRDLSANAEVNNWFTERLHNQKSFKKQHETQCNYWADCRNLMSPAALTSHTIVALNVVDPRLQRPQKRSKAVPSNTSQTLQLDNVSLLMPPAHLAASALWCADVRHHLCAHMLSNADYCQLRAENAVVPGAPCKFESELQPVPVLLIQRPGSQQMRYKRLGYGCGWDIIVPAGYGMSFWLAMIMWGAKPGGLREFDTIAREMGTEQQLPDTIGGLQLAAERHLELRNKYFRLPTNKRHNYRKLSIVSPFYAPFKQLIRDWQPNATSAASAASATDNNSTTNANYYVLRDRNLLYELDKCLLNTQNKLALEISAKCLIQLQLRMKSRGNPSDFALICLPTSGDLKRNLKRIKFENHVPVYTEPLLADPCEKTRKVLRQQHKKLLKRLRARRVREKRKKQETSTTPVRIRSANTAHLVAAQYKKMCALWLPEDFTKLYSVRKQCKREVFGYITNANFCFTEATTCGIGYVTIEGLKRLQAICRKAQLRQPMCLVRGTNTRHYRFASFKINLDL